jgi:hypothetical protein
LIVGIVATQQVRDPIWVFRLAVGGLVLGAIIPWLPDIISSPGFFAALALASKSFAGPGIFGFATSFLLKSVEDRPNA